LMASAHVDDPNFPMRDKREKKAGKPGQ
jgi:hypothetical protein